MHSCFFKGIIMWLVYSVTHVEAYWQAPQGSSGVRGGLQVAAKLMGLTTCQEDE